MAEAEDDNPRPLSEAMRGMFKPEDRAALSKALEQSRASFALQAKDIDWERLKRFTEAHRNDPPSPPKPPGEGVGSGPKKSGGEVAGEVPPRKPRGPRRPSGSGFDRISGRRPMREYPLTKGELHELASRSFLSTLGFSGASAAFTVWLGIVQGMAFADTIKPEVKAYWQAWQSAAGWASIVLFAFGAAMMVWNGLRVREIIKETDHGG
ncbi:MAG: hypothetical protein EOP61_05525 [Sphingomonadales bacterium]|nr:MAG: hypothetical protein EOP61_05525 [Sphingomonadales bacterium]